MANAATKNRPAQHETPANSDRPAQNAPDNSNPTKPENDSPKQRGRAAKPAYPGLVVGQLLTAVPTDWVEGTHAKLMRNNFATPELFKDYVKHYNLGKKPHPSLVGENGKAKQIDMWPEDVKIEFVCGGPYQELSSDDFSTKALYYSQLVLAVESALAPLRAKAERMAKMTPADIAREEGVAAILRKQAAQDAKLLELCGGDMELFKSYKSQGL